MTTHDIIMAFNNNLSDDKDYTITELKKILTDIYNLKTKNYKKEKAVKVKKEPSPYNIFVKEHYNEFKIKNPTATAPEIMKMIAELWKNKDNVYKGNECKKQVNNIDDNDEKNVVKKNKDGVKNEVKNEVNEDTINNDLSTTLPDIEKPKKRTVKK